MQPLRVNEMKIDWFTFVAQIVNFLILVALLHHFLYKRVLRAMDERQARIQEKLDNARQKEKEAEQEAERLRRQKKNFEKEKENMFAEATEEVKHWKDKQLEQAKSETEQRKRHWQESVANEKSAFFKELRRRIVAMTCNLSRRALTEMADTNLEQQMTEVFFRKLDNLDDKESDRFQKAVDAAKGTVRVATSVDLPESLRNKLMDGLKQRFENIASVEFQTDPELAMGIQATAYDRKLAWSLDAYLAPLESNLNGFIDSSTQKEKQT